MQEDILSNIAFSRRGSVFAIEQENYPIYFRSPHIALTNMSGRAVINISLPGLYPSLSLRPLWCRMSVSYGFLLN